MEKQMKIIVKKTKKLQRAKRKVEKLNGQLMEADAAFTKLEKMKNEVIHEVENEK